MSSDPQDDKTALEALREVLTSAPVRFWICPIEAHHHDYPEPPRETVRWIDGVAHCMEPDCGRTSADPVRPQETLRERRTPQ